MKITEIKTKVVHSKTQSAWNVLGIQLGGKYKIARVPYVVTDWNDINKKNRKEALEHAEFISYCFNNSNKILNK